MIAATETVAVAAPPAAVWALLADPSRWPRWDEAVDWAVLEGPCVPGSYLTVKPKRGRQTAYRLAVVVEPERFSLELTFGPLARLRRSWSISATPGGSSVAGTVEVDGPLAGFLAGGMARRAAAALPAGLARLAAVAGEEKRGRRAAALEPIMIPNELLGCRGLLGSRFHRRCRLLGRGLHRRCGLLGRSLHRRCRLLRHC